MLVTYSAYLIGYATRHTYVSRLAKPSLRQISLDSTHPPFDSMITSLNIVPVDAVKRVRPVELNGAKIEMSGVWCVVCPLSGLALIRQDNRID